MDTNEPARLTAKELSKNFVENQRSLRIHLQRCGRISFKVPIAELEHAQSNKKFKCVNDNCNSSFSSKVVLNEHIERVHRTTLIKCPYKNCGEYQKLRTILSHIRHFHNKIR